MHRLPGDERTQSELLGTILVFSLVITVGTILILTGYLVFDDASQDFNNRLGQDSMQEIDSRLLSVEGGTTLQIPEGTDDQFTLNENNVSVTVTVRTNGSQVLPIDGKGGKEVTLRDRPEILAREDPTYDNGTTINSTTHPDAWLTQNYSFNVGEIVHDTGDVKTVYQGGYLFEQEGDVTRILSEPGFDYREEAFQGSIDFSFASVAGIQSLSSGGQFVHPDRERSLNMSGDIENMIRQQQSIGSDPEKAARIADLKYIDVEIETDYKSAWRQYAEDRMTDKPAQVLDPSSDSISFRFDNLIAEESVDVSENVNFVDSIIFSGEAGLAHAFYDPDAGEIESTGDGPQFEVTDSFNYSSSNKFRDNAYSVAIAEDGNWHIAKPNDGSLPVTGSDNVAWLTIEDGNISASSDGPDDWDDSYNPFNSDTWNFDSSETFICVIGAKDSSSDPFGGIIDLMLSGACGETFVAGDTPPMPEQQLEITSVDAPDTVFADSDFDVEVSIDNVGNGIIKNSFVGGEIEVLDGYTFEDFERVTIPPFNETQANDHDIEFNEYDDGNLTLTMDAPNSDNVPAGGMAEICIAAASMDAANCSEEVEIDNSPEFIIPPGLPSEGTTWNQRFNNVTPEEGVLPGSEFTVQVNVTNRGAAAKRPVTLFDVDEGLPVDGKLVDLGSSGDTVDNPVNLTWNVPADITINDDRTFNISTPSDEFQFTVPEYPVPKIENVDITPPRAGALGDDSTTDMTVTISNPSDITAENLTLRINESASENDFLESVPSSVEYNSITDTINRTFTLDLEDDPVDDFIKVEVEADMDETVSDEYRASAAVRREGPYCSQVSWDGSGTESDPYEISNVDELQCMNEDMNGNGEGDFNDDLHWEVTEDIAALGTQYWGDDVLPAGSVIDDHSVSESELLDELGFQWSDLDESTSPRDLTSGVFDWCSEKEEGWWFPTTVGWNCDFSSGSPDPVGLFDDNPDVDGSDIDECDDYIEFNFDDEEFDTDFSCEETTSEPFVDDPEGFAPIGPHGNNYPNTDHDSWPDDQIFYGEFNGSNNLIDSLYIDRPDEMFVGLFGAAGYPNDYQPIGYGATIRNVVLENVSVHGEQHVGGLAGQMGGTVLDSSSSGTVIGEETLVGGLIGDGAHADIDNRVVAEGTVRGGAINPDSGANSLNHEGIGGLVGRSTWQTRISTGYTRNIDVEGDRYVGGITGTSSYITSQFEQMYSAGSVTAYSTNYEGIHDAGGIVGTVLEKNDDFDISVFMDQDVYGADPIGALGNHHRNIEDYEFDGDDIQEQSTDEMQGPSVLPTRSQLQADGMTDTEIDEFYDGFPGPVEKYAEGTMAELNWSIWEPVYDFNAKGEPKNEDYPIFQWQSDGFLNLEVDGVTATPSGKLDTSETPPTYEVSDSSQITLEVQVESEYGSPVQKDIYLQNPDPDEPTQIVDQIEGLQLDPGETKTVSLTWGPSEFQAESVVERIADDPSLDEIAGTFLVRSDKSVVEKNITMLPGELADIDVEFLGDPVSGSLTATVDNVTLDARTSVGGSGDFRLVDADDNLIEKSDVNADREVFVVANGRPVEAVTIHDLYDGVEFGWEPQLVDIGTSALRLEVEGSSGSDQTDVTVTSPVDPFVVSDDIPLQANLDFITSGD